MTKTYRFIDTAEIVTIADTGPNHCAVTVQAADGTQHHTCKCHLLSLGVDDA